MEFSVKDNLWWGTELRLTSWLGYQSRHGPYGGVDQIEPSDGRVSLIFAPEGRGLEPLRSEEMSLISWFEKNESSISNAVKTAIMEWCSPRSLDRMTKFDFDDDFPIIESDGDLRHNIGLHSINIHQLDVDGVPYVGYEFGCEWEEEHGLGVLMHGTRVVDVGFADTAILLWIAEADAEKVAMKRT